MCNRSQTHQYNIIMGVAMLTAVAIVISNLLAERSYAFVDPDLGTPDAGYPTYPDLARASG